MWKQLIKLITLFLWMTSISPRPLHEPTDNAVGPSLEGISSKETSFGGISHHLMTDEDVDVSFTLMFSIEYTLIRNFLIYIN